MTEKRKPIYDLEAFKLTFADVTGLNATTTALKSAAALGFGRDDIIATLQTMQRTHFYKSMTSYEDHQATKIIKCGRTFIMSPPTSELCT